MFKEQMPIEDSSKPESGEPSDAEKLKQLEREKLDIKNWLKKTGEFIDSLPEDDGQRVGWSKRLTEIRNILDGEPIDRSGDVK